MAARGAVVGVVGAGGKVAAEEADIAADPAAEWWQYEENTGHE